MEDSSSSPDEDPWKGARMATIHLHENTTSTPEQFIAALTDFGPGRSEIFGCIGFRPARS